MLNDQIQIMTGNSLLVPPRSAFGSREELCAFVSYKMRRATELFTFKCSLYQRELKLYLPEPVPKHRRWIDTFDSESIVTIPISKIEKDEIELFRKYFPDNMDLDSIFPGDLLQRSFKKRISSLLTSLVNKIVFLLVLRHDTWYVHQEARDGLREYLVEKIWPRQPKLRLLYRDHVTTFVDTRIRHFRDSVGRYFRDLHANSKNGEIIANLIVTCDYKQSELDDMIKKALEEQKVMLENEKRMDYIESPNRTNYEKLSGKSSLLSSQTEKLKNKSNKIFKNDERPFNNCNLPDFNYELEEEHEGMDNIAREENEDFRIEEDLEYHVQDLEKELESYNDLEREIEQNPEKYKDLEKDIDEKYSDQIREQRLKLKLKQKMRQKERSRLKLKHESENEDECELVLDCDNREELDEKNDDRRFLEDYIEYDNEFVKDEKSMKGYGEMQKSKRILSSQRNTSESELERTSNNGIKNEKSAIHPPLKKNNKNDNLRYSLLYNMGISNSSNNSSSVVSIPSIPSIPSIQSISTNITSTMSTSSSSSSLTLPPGLASGLNVIPSLGYCPSQIQINSPIDKSSIYASFLYPQSSSVFTRENIKNLESSSNSNSSLESNSSVSNIVYRNIQTDTNNVSSTTSSLSNSSVSSSSPISKTCSRSDTLSSGSVGSGPISNSHIPSSFSDSGIAANPGFGLALGMGSGLGPGLGEGMGSGFGLGMGVGMGMGPGSDSGLDMKIGAENSLDSSSNPSSRSNQSSNPTSLGSHGHYATLIANYPYCFGHIKDCNSVLGSPFIFPQQLNPNLQSAHNFQVPPAYFIVPNYNYAFHSLFPTQSGLSQFNPFWFSSTNLNNFWPIDLSKVSGQSDIDQLNYNNTTQTCNNS
ncbi:uncharacterized protein ELE39_000399 [Cryptosporidium sp. chipmunk genotype I]|uniref:uncharacterized protein n=1 Tax=Cryptosporidium sp. chipmunk genotype I TaxID=1280935 RepID=UPI003519D957|nr:hypothetical protein ELE39_000399 [Cryptosporidium sp. chipmunk genotype I]